MTRLFSARKIMILKDLSFHLSIIPSRKPGGHHCNEFSLESLHLNDAAPLGQERRTPATRRLRRRGPRSQLALLRRSVPKERRKLSDISPGEAGDPMSDDLIINKPHAQINKIDVFIYSLNIRCLLAHLDELTSFLNDHRPHIVFLQEI